MGYENDEDDYGFSSAVSLSENDSFGDEQAFVNYYVPHTITPTIHTMAIFTSLLTVFGFFTNCVAIGMLSAQIFERMSFSVLMKILCMYNIIVLFLGTVRYHSFYLDFRTHITQPDRCVFCMTLLWFILVFRHARTASIVLIVYNRINSLSHPDYFLKYVDAIRLPILGNALFLLMSTVYVSRYISTLDKRTKKYNRTECTFAYMMPYKRVKDLTSDNILSNLPIFEHGTILCMLIFLFIKYIRKSRSKYTNDMASESMTSSPPPQRNVPPSQHRLSVRKLRTHSSLARFSVLPTQGVMEIKEILFPVSSCRVEERDAAVIPMAVTIALMNMITSGLREGVDSFLLFDILTTDLSDKQLFQIRSYLDLSFFTFMATMFFFMCLTCSYFPQAAFNLLYGINLGDSHSESSIGYGSSHVNTLPIETIIHTDAMEVSSSEKKLVAPTCPEEGDENPLTTGSVWSLDRTYFLNATRQHALIETF